MLLAHIRHMDSLSNGTPRYQENDIGNQYRALRNQLAAAQPAAVQQGTHAQQGEAATQPATAAAADISDTLPAAATAADIMPDIVPHYLWEANLDNEQ